MKATLKVAPMPAAGNPVDAVETLRRMMEYNAQAKARKLAAQAASKPVDAATLQQLEAYYQKARLGPAKKPSRLNEQFLAACIQPRTRGDPRARRKSNLRLQPGQWAL